MKVSEINREFAANFLKLDFGSLGDSEKNELDMCITAAKEFVKSYTGLSEDEIDTHEDITHAALILIQDMFDNRARYVQNSASSPNKTVESILGLHCANLL